MSDEQNTYWNVLRSDYELDVDTDMYMPDAEFESDPNLVEEGRTQVNVSGADLHNWSRSYAGGVLANNGLGLVMRQGGNLVRATRLDRRSQLRTAQVNLDSLTGRVSRVCKSIILKKKGQDWIAVPVLPKETAVRDLKANLVYKFPPIKAVTGIPVLKPSGEWVRDVGLDTETGYWYDPRVKISWDTHEGVQWALRTLQEAVCDFQFRDRADKLNWLGAVLLPFVRPVVLGPTPMHMVMAPVAGSGKSLLVDVGHMISTGVVAQRIPLPSTDEACSKMLLSKLLEAPPFLVLDNVHSIRGYSSLEACLTATEYSDRILGVSAMASVDVSCVFYATANNPDAVFDIARRVVPIWIDTGLERPSDRPPAVFKHADLYGWVRDNRTALVKACVNLVQAWVDAGMPCGKGVMGSYENYACVISGILENAGCGGWMGNHAEFLDSGDTTGTSERRFIELWWQTKKGAPVTISELVHVMAMEDGLVEGLGLSDKDTSKSLGKFMRGLLGRRFGNVKVHRLDKSRYATYRLDSVE